MRCSSIAIAYTISILISCSRSQAEVHWLTPTTDLKEVIKSVVAGDTVFLEDGYWEDVELKLDRLPGTADAPIVIKAETPGGVIFTGRTKFRFSGQYVVVSGFVFRNSDDTSDVCEFRSHSERHAHHSRLTDCVFEQESDFYTKKEGRWLSVYGTHNRVDHCYFAGKTTRGTTLVVWVANKPQYHRIDHNHFGPRPKLGKNGGETIRIGTSEVSESESGTIVEDNYFQACDGEAEVLSNKSCGNIYRHNVFEQCAGALTLRHGHRCLVTSNVFFGGKKSGTGGVRIIGRDHTVANNYFEGLRGDAERAAICLMNGIPNSPLKDYAPVEQVAVIHNTFIDCKVSVEIGVGAGKKQSADPKNCVFFGNLFAPDKWQISRVHIGSKDFTWERNRLSDSRPPRDAPVDLKQVKMDFKRATDGMLRPIASGALTVPIDGTVKNDVDGQQRSSETLCGCDDPATSRRSLASPKTTGPEWRRLTTGQ